MHHLIPARRSDLVLMLIKKKKETYCLEDFVIPENDKVKIKKSEKIDKYLDLARELKQLQNMKLAGILVIVVALGTVL